MEWRHTALGAVVGFALGWLTRASRRAAAAPAEDSAAAPRAAAPTGGGRVKLVMVVRTDLDMGKGKMCAQCGHAAVAACMRLRQEQPRLWEEYEANGQPKIAVKIKSEKDMMDLELRARKAGLRTYLICDAGRTQLAPNTNTVLAVGPGYEEDIDRFTKHLPLL